MTHTMSIDEALRNVTSATYTRWIEYRTPSGNWSRKRHQETQDTITPKEARFLAENQHLYGNKRRYLPGTPLPTRFVNERPDLNLRRVATVEYHHQPNAA